MERIGPLVIVEGPNKSKVPFSRSLYIDCKEKVLIDSGADKRALLDIKRELGIELILNTHYHPDHIQHNSLFPQAAKWINPIEFETIQSIDRIAEANGIYQEWGEAGVKMWRTNLPEEWIQNIEEISGTYDYETEYSFSNVNVTFLHTPGHTKGLSSPYFSDLGVAYVSDYDMTSFGPWYNGKDGNIEEFIESGKRLLSLDANTYITGHQKGIFTKQEFQNEMETYLEIIDKRDHTIEQYVRKGLTFEEITDIGIFYPKNSLNVPIFKTWERSGIRKHLHRLGLTVSERDGALVDVK
ncbi:MBL fold metallo-hydrolase [Halalkalibacter alkalisediminis]|uniref:MBL fold metallo-hydrolase n=2 Tax=Halalkalibacter alkalisediminis TaxID=935616 RepID=A0ABV6NFL2_9BACI|nr:MBL fold metallo-hydrolase [Halalkalibacter alkalisediminis]